MTSNTTKQDALLNELFKGYTDPKDILGEHGLLKQSTQRLVERALEAEMTAHLGYAPHGPGRARQWQLPQRQVCENNSDRNQVLGD
jgi:transposase-like protein